jgi:hypothetical protein
MAAGPSLITLEIAGSYEIAVSLRAPSRRTVTVHPFLVLKQANPKAVCG